MGEEQSIKLTDGDKRIDIKVVGNPSGELNVSLYRDLDTKDIEQVIVPFAQAAGDIKPVESELIVSDTQLEQVGAQDLSKTLEQIEAEEYPLVSDTGKRYRYIADGLREYQSGARYQEGKGLVGNPSAQITTENAKELSINGHEAKRQKAIEGMKKAIANKRQLGATIAASADVHEYWGEALGEVMLEPGKNQVAALRLAAEGPLELIGKRDAKVEDGQGNSISGDPVFVERVLAAIAKSKNAG